MTSTSFVLCADDFGLSPGVCRGILELVEGRRLSAVGCMMTEPPLFDFADKLLRKAEDVDIGVHLVLTDQCGLTAGLAALPSQQVLFREALLRRLDLKSVKNEVAQQLDAFHDLFGRAPDFVDGHHHVHQLPGIRTTVAALIAERYRSSIPPMRSTFETTSIILRRRVEIAKTGLLSVFGKGFQVIANEHGIRTNLGFSGIYDLSGRVPYAELFDRFTDFTHPAAMIMCHPGYVDDILLRKDSLTGQRERELTYFLSDSFCDLLRRKRLVLGRFS